EHEHRGPRHGSARDLDDPLLTEAEIARILPREVLEPEGAERLDRSAVTLRRAASEHRAAERLDLAFFEVVTDRAHRDVLRDRQLGDKSRGLERSYDPEPAASPWRHGAQVRQRVVNRQGQFLCLSSYEAGDRIDHGALAGAVRT